MFIADEELERGSRMCPGKTSARRGGAKKPNPERAGPVLGGIVITYFLRLMDRP
jgi:hypothetical protein